MTSGTHSYANGSGAASTPQTHGFDPDFTPMVINAIGPKASPRLRKVTASLIQHLHDFARENEITLDEWKVGIDLIKEAGQISTVDRDELVNLSDIIGFETLADEITYKLVTDAPNEPTLTAALGPFWSPESPVRKMGESIVHNTPDGDYTYMYGEVTDFLTGKPIEGAELDIWQAAPNGLYSGQDKSQVESNLRGRFKTGTDGRYDFYCLRPTGYPIPDDGPAGKLLRLLDRSRMRPAHLHFIIRAPGYRPVVTQIFDRRDEHLEDDAVFSVKKSLIVDFLPRKGDSKAQFELQFDFRLATLEEAAKTSSVGATEGTAGSGAGVTHAGGER